MHCRSLFFSGIAILATSLTGCSTNFAPAPEPPVQTALGPISGIVHGGQQPIAGAHVFALQTSTIAYGGASTSLIGFTGVSGYPTTEDLTQADPTYGFYYVTTDANGYFQIDSSVTCTAGTVVYLYSVGGNSGFDTPPAVNSAAGLLAVLGTCPSNGQLVNAITTGASAQIYMNEVSTVAAAYALAGFAETSANVPTDALHIGAYTTQGGYVFDTLAQTGIQNAAANAAQMYAAVASSDGGNANPGSTRAANATTPNGNGAVPQAELDTLANVLAACINSVGPSSPACSSSSATPGLFYYATSDGTTSGTLATDTATAALNIAHHPAHDATALYNLVGSTADPFTPALTSAPSNFTVLISFSGGGTNSFFGGSPTAEDANVFGEQDVAIDAAGNVFTGNFLTNTLTKLSALGVPADGSPFSGNTLNEPANVAIDTSGNAWVTNSGGYTVSVFTNAGGVSQGPYTSDLAAGGIAFDAFGNYWLCSYNGSSVRKYTSTGNVLVGETQGNGLNGPVNLAVESGTLGNVWVANYLGDDATAFTNTGAVDGGSPYEILNSPNSVTIDSSGNIWYADYTAGIHKVSQTGVSLALTPIGNAQLLGIAVDGASNVWTAVDGTNNMEITEVNNSDTVLSSTSTLGYGTPSAGTPIGIAVDGSGDVWYTIDNSTSLEELIGAAIPVATPIAYGTANNLLGSRP